MSAVVVVGSAEDTVWEADSTTAALAGASILRGAMQPLLLSLPRSPVAAAWPGGKGGDGGAEPTSLTPEMAKALVRRFAARVGVAPRLPGPLCLSALGQLATRRALLGERGGAAMPLRRGVACVGSCPRGGGRGWLDWGGLERAVGSRVW